MEYIGDFAASSTLRWMWNTNGQVGASITRATDGTLRIYKDASDTQRTSSAGITDTEDMDGQTGVHRVVIDLSDNTDAGFYAAGHDYFVVLSGATIDGQTVNAAICAFSIENRTAAVRDKTGFTLSSAGVQAIWDAATSALTTVGSIGKYIVDKLAVLTTDTSTIQTNQATIINRIGAFTGSGINTILGFFKAMMRKDAALTPSDVGGTFDNTTDSLEAIRDRGDASWNLNATNTDNNDDTTIAGQISRTHALAGGTPQSKDHSAVSPAILHKNRAASATLITRTRSVVGNVETVTPS